MICDYWREKNVMLSRIFKIILIEIVVSKNWLKINEWELVL